jgi:hypothetical protein
MNLNNQIFTNAGLDMLGAANAGSTLNITKLVAGSGSASVEADIYPLVALIAWQADATIIRKTDLGGGEIIISGALVESLLPAGAPFPLKELGVMAKIGTGPEQLYSASNVFTDAPQTVTPGGTSTVAFDITIVIDRATDVSITLGDPNTVDCQNIPSDSTVGPGVYASRLGNIFQFKRLVAGPNVQLIETSDRITVSIKSITANLNLYVPPSHPACPSPDVGFATIQAALDYLAPFIIPPDKTVTIHIDKGTFTSNAQITFSHPNSQQIFIQGEPRVDKTITAINYVDPTHKNVQVTDTSGLVVGQRMYIANSIAGWSGGCKITGIVGAVVTVSTEKRDSQPNFTTSDTGSGRRLSYYPTVLVLNDPGKVMTAFYCPYGIGGISNLTMDGGNACLALKGECFVTNVSLWNATRGVAGDTTHFLGECVITQCDFGVITGSGPAIANSGQLYINACGDALACQSAVVGSQTSGQDTVKVYLAHNQIGIQAYAAAQFRGGSLLASSNNFVAFADLNSVVVINPGGGYQSTFDNNGLGLKAQGMSFIEYVKNGGAAPSCDPPAETLGNQNSLIHVV